ncbi:cytochrome b family protein [Sphaerisporangium rhizosphaerae]|uniref:Cytochrome bc1 complex cytochrome b subunit n=1 Tax=Sphaerisporangium rhizosphaerae TaxID=2269375 RepID=A0ABW2NZK9_9ACTN
MRQLMGDILVYCFVVVLLTGGFLAYYYEPGGGTVAYDGSYAPLQGAQMSDAYASVLKIRMDVRGGLLVRQLHHNSSVLLGLGVVAWILFGRFRYGFAALGLGALTGLAGYASADDLLSGTFLAKVPIPVWYGLHLTAAATLGAVLVVSSRREAAQRPRTLGFVALSIGLTALAIYSL